jgi:2-polyprenyl-3-methyl-5-hydroxy-6-metoxy-1,4-benzoquinol methylase
MEDTMFTIGEEAEPTEQSRTLVRKFAEQLIPSFKNAEEIRSHYHWHGDRISFDLDYADKYLKPADRILEVGGYPFLLTLPMMSKDYDVTSLEKCSSIMFDPTVVQKFKVNVLDCDLDVDKVPADDSSFDCVIMNEVFEHLRINLIASMRELRRVLRPNGILLLSTPNLRSVEGINNLLRRQEAYSSMGGIFNNYAYLEEHGIMGHVREYTSKEVMDFLKQIGFEIEGVIYRGRYSGSWLRRLSQQFTRLRPEFKPYFSIVARKK